MAIDKQLARLKSVDLRAVWSSEAAEFTPWLAQEENLALLGETVGLDLELDSMERWVGPFRADIVCKDTVTNTWVLIENQLERTDHSHLGQLITYAAGLDAVTIVWIADRFTEEHRAALDWLNEVTDQSINFFGLEIELWQIGTSPFAPKFNVVSKPNDWIKIVTASRQAASEEVTPTKQMQLEYWTAFKEYLEERGSILRSQKPFPQHWTNFAIGRSGFTLGATVNTRENVLGVHLVMLDENSKVYFHLLHREREAIENELGLEIEWRELPQRKQSYLTLNNSSFEMANRAQWPEQYAWLCNMLEAFHRVFAARVKALDVGDYIPENGVGE